MAIRAWAMDTDIAAKAVRSVDRERLLYVQMLFEDLGFKSSDARMRSEMFYGYINGRHLSAVQGTAAELQAQFSLLTSK